MKTVEKENLKKGQTLLNGMKHSNPEKAKIKVEIDMFNSMIALTDIYLKIL